MANGIKPGTLRVQIQTQSGCDGRCVFCPNAATLQSKAISHGRMAPALYRKIIDELASLAPRRISPYLMNEPLLDDRLPEFIRYTTERIPQTTTLVTSNGTHLTEKMGPALIHSGLRRLKISLQSLDPETNRKLMGASCDAAAIVQNILEFKQLLNKKRAKHLDLRVSMIVTNINAGEIRRTRRFWRRHGIRLVTSALENRGGNIDAVESLNPHPMAEYHIACARPSRELCILWNGDVVLCCVDWWRTTLLGNLRNQSVLEVWQSPRLEAIRRALRENDHDALPEICVHCEESARPDHHRPGLKGFLSRHFKRAPRENPCQCQQAPTERKTNGA